jgi:hypothetical protein
MASWNKWREQNRDVRPNPIGAALISRDLSVADLRSADLSVTNLSSALLGGANLSGTRLHNPDLRSVNFSEARVRRTTFADVDLGKVKRLATVRHYRPSSIRMLQNRVAIRILSQEGSEQLLRRNRRAADVGMKAFEQERQIFENSVNHGTAGSQRVVREHSALR